MPTTNKPMRSAAWTMAARSISSVAPASTTMPLRPAAATAMTVSGPIAGKSARRSCPGLLVLTRTPPAARPLHRSRSASVPSGPSRSITLPPATTTAWPRSRAPCSRAAARPSAMSDAAAASGACLPSNPSDARSPPRMLSAPTTAKPSASSAWIAARSRPSSPSARQPSAAKNLSVRQSGRSASSEGRRTPPAMTSSRTPRARRMARPLPACPNRIQACGTFSTMAGSAAPMKAKTKTGRCALAHASIRRPGSAPEPARMPSGPDSAAAIGARLTQAADRFGAGEFDHVAHRADGRELLVHRRQPFGEGAGLVAEKHLIGRAQCLDFVAGEATALHADDIEARKPRAVADHRAIGNDIAFDAGDAADHGVATDADELMHRRQAAEDGVILDPHVAGERRVVGHDDVIADDAIVSDVGADHEGAIVADARHHPATRGAGIDRHVLAEDVVAADLEPRFFALVLEILWNMADRREREDARAIADRGAAGDGDVRDQLDALAELDLGADQAERPNDRSGSKLGARLDDGRRMDLRHTRTQL